jgi:hypothetical protein
MGWDLQNALSLYLEAPAQSHKTTTTSFGSSHHFSTSNTNKGSILPDMKDPSSDIFHSALQRVAAEGFNGNIEETFRHMQSVMRDGMPSGGIDMDEDDEEDDYVYPGGNGGRRADEYDEDGVRKPDRVRVQQLIPTQHFPSFTQSKRGLLDDPTVDWIVKPPPDISFPENFDTVKSPFALISSFFTDFVVPTNRQKKQQHRRNYGY